MFFGVALASITTLFLIALFLFVEGLPIFKVVPVTDFIFGEYWYPTDDPADFGIFTLILASIAVTLVSSAISIPLGVLTALYLAEGASARVREWVRSWNSWQRFRWWSSAFSAWSSWRRFCRTF